MGGSLPQMILMFDGAKVLLRQFSLRCERPILAALQISLVVENWTVNRDLN